MTNLWVFDIDGTLANIDHRMHFWDGDQKDRNAFFGHQHLDIPYEPVVEVYHSLVDAGYKCIIITGRDEIHRAVTFDWIQKHCDHYFNDEDLFMRERVTVEMIIS